MFYYLFLYRFSKKINTSSVRGLIPVLTYNVATQLANKRDNPGSHFNSWAAANPALKLSPAPVDNSGFLIKKLFCLKISYWLIAIVCFEE